MTAASIAVQNVTGRAKLMMGQSDGNDRPMSKWNCRAEEWPIVLAAVDLHLMLIEAVPGIAGGDAQWQAETARSLQVGFSRLKVSDWSS
jgi:hypothetical protein